METVAFPLVKLPLELRRLIYYHYFFKDGIMCQISGIPPSRVKPLEVHHVGEQNLQATVPSSCTGFQATLRSNINAMPLLLSCHQT